MNPKLISNCGPCFDKPSLRVSLIDCATGDPVDLSGGGVATRQVVATSSQVIPFTDATPISLAPPVGAVIAEISVEGGNARFTTDGTTPDNAIMQGHRVTDWGRIELESPSEVTSFQLVGLPGHAGSIYVEYFVLSTLTNV